MNPRVGTRTFRQLLPAWACLPIMFIVACLCTSPNMAHAQDTPAPRTVAYTSHRYAGQLGNSHLLAELTRIGSFIFGNVTTTLPDSGRPTWSYFEGYMRTDGTVLLRDESSKYAFTWVLGTDSMTLTGHRNHSPRTVTLHRQVESDAAPHVIALTIDGHIGGSGCRIQAIVLKLQGKTMQTLPTRPDIRCRYDTPQWEDLDFDGHPDLMLKLSRGNGPNAIFAEWLYSPARKRFMKAPQSLRDISSPQTDPAAKIIYSQWRANCCSHGVTLYRWQHGEVVEVDSGSSYFLPVMHQGELWACYVVPEYAGHGQITSPLRVEEQADASLHLNFRDIGKGNGCGKGVPFNVPQRIILHIWRTDPRTNLWQSVRTYRGGWIRADTAKGTRWCPRVPAFDHGRVRWLTRADDPSKCLRYDPSQ